MTRGPSGVSEAAPTAAATSTGKQAATIPATVNATQSADGNVSSVPVRKRSPNRKPRRKTTKQGLLLILRREEKKTFLRAYRATGGDMTKALQVVKELPRRADMTFSSDTAHGWCIRDTVFRAEFEQAQRDIRDGLEGRMPGLATLALDTVEAIIKDEDTPANVRLSGATSVLKSVGVFTDKQTLEHTGKDGGPIQIKEIEVRLSGNGNGS